MKYRNIGFAFIAVATFALSGCGKDNTATAATSTPPPAASIAVVAPAADYETSGLIVVENQVDVLSQRDGIVAQILLDTGDRVKKGQLLAQIDNRQLQADRDAAEARWRSIQAELLTQEAAAKVLENDYDRDQEMFKAQLITAKQLEHSRYKMIGSGHLVERERQNLKNAQSILRSLDLELEKTSITAPFGGVVARRYVREGQKVAPNDRLFWITAVTPVNVQFTLPQSFLGKIARGDKLTVISPEFPDKQHIATVRLISPVADPSSGTIEVQAELAAVSSSLLPGTNALVRVAQPK
ncbi:MAG TPA: efflux RND transporter periplasmic adaptor subunit [Terriglobales bacterium]|nr:efflux RND transporter periplasmic adaptor subunit [Terriglobales bacterium]